MVTIVSHLLLGCALFRLSMAVSSMPVSTFHLEDLQNGYRSSELLGALRSTGLFSVRLPGGQDDLRARALKGVCECLPKHNNNNAQGFDFEGMDSTLLDDGITRRTTVATATVGTSPLPFSSHDLLEKHCGQGTVEAMEALRDQVALVSQSFIQSFDQLFMQHNGLETPLLRDDMGRPFASLKSIVQSANHLEHFHHYSKDVDSSAEQVDEKDDDASSLTLEWHTDAGLFLVFVPAWDCNSKGEPDASFWVQQPDGQRSLVRFEPGSAIVMMGTGAEHWLDTSLGIRATRHAVRMRNGEARAWYGMMHLVPDNAVIQAYPNQETFGGMKSNMRLLAASQLQYGKMNSMNPNVAAVGCGPVTTDFQPFNQDIVPELILPSRRRLQHVQDASACNNATNFFCWMQCLEIPNYQQAESYESEGYSLYCLDPGVLAQSGNKVSQAVKPCTGNVHNSNCMGVWHLESPLIPGQKVNYNATASGSDDTYCFGGTSMYMDGFHWVHDTTCVIYLFPGWVLSSQGRFAAACIGTLIFGILVEVVISRRRVSMTSMEPGYRRLAASACFYGLQLSMGYLIMLVVMTYSAPLFICCVLGLVGGHILFNSKDALLSRPASKDTQTGWSRVTSMNGSDPMARDEETASEKPGEVMTALSECCCTGQEANITEHVDHEVPEGSTPCCQNIL